MESTVAKGDAFENLIYDFLDNEIKQGRFFGTDSSRRIFKKKKYYSRDRDADIVFDLAIEFYLPGAVEFSFVFLVECKDYNSPVPASDLEEFKSKADQVAPANSKLVLATSGPLQFSAINYARAKKIGLLRYFGKENFKWELYRASPLAGSAYVNVFSFDLDELLTSNSYKSTAFEYVFDTGIGRGESLFDFAKRAITSLPISNHQISNLFEKNLAFDPIVPYLSKDYLEKKAEKILHDGKYSGGFVDLDRFVRLVPGLIIEREERNSSSVLGKVVFSPIKITLYLTNDGRRDRFTMAHEMSHIFLEHGKFILKEVCEDADLENLESPEVLPEDIRRIEFQANFLAACILMPKSEFVRDFQDLSALFGIKNRGFGHLFLDHQETNKSDYMRIVQRLISKYEVSRSAVHIRLQTLGLLRVSSD